MMNNETPSFMQLLNAYLSCENVHAATVQTTTAKASSDIVLEISRSPLYNCEISLNDIPCPAYLSKLDFPEKATTMTTTTNKINKPLVAIKKKERKITDKKVKKASCNSDKENVTINSENTTAKDKIKEHKANESIKETKSKPVRKPLCNIQSVTNEKKKFKAT